MLKNKLKNSNNMLFLSLIFEKDQFLFLTKNLFYKNTQYIIIENQNIFKSLKFLNELRPILLNDMMFYDYIKINTFDFTNNYNVNAIYQFYSYKLNSYKNFILINNTLVTLTEFFYNCIWLEREQKEFFGVSFLNTKDSRNLLLDYGYTKNILLKSEEVSDTFDKTSNSNHETTLDDNEIYNI